MTTFERAFGASHAFDHPITIFLVGGIVVALLIGSVMIRLLNKQGKFEQETFIELKARIRSWYVIAALMVVPILLGSGFAWLFFLLLSVFCFQEFAKATNIDKQGVPYATVVGVTLFTFFAALDHWMGLFTTSWAIGIFAIAVFALWPDEPKGYIHRISLAIIGYSLFGISLGHMAYIGNDVDYRPIMLWILVCTELNDVFAYICGKKLGKSKLLPNTSPGKTWNGFYGAVLLTTILSTVIGRFVFEGSDLAQWHHLVIMGLLIGVLGQCGDLVVSSIKRDLGVKDMGETIPGHGGLLDRFDSLLVVGPVLFHYINYFRGIGVDQATQLITG